MDSPRLHQDTIESVKEKLNIVEIISEHVVLRKQGRGLVGLCPFHTEKTPSFSVDPTKQLYYCFGCAAGGNAFNFLMEVNKTSFSEVILELAQRYQVPIQTQDPEERQQIQRQISLKEQLYEIMAVTSKFYQHTLYQPQGEKALDYLKSVRHLSNETIQKFELGYAPEGWEILYRYLVEIKRYPLGLVAEAGLIKKRNGAEGFYDQFRSRLMIPIYDRTGRVIAFGSRTLTQEEPKYLNSPETPLFNKSKTLFALDKAYKSIKTEDQAIVVEGYFDAIALHSAGITNVVACLGTALTQSQIKILSSYCDSKEIVLNFDGDAAGTQATTRVINEIEAHIYSEQVILKVLNLPQGKDADEFLNNTEQGSTIYHSRLKAALPWLDWQLQQLLIKRDLKDPGQFQKVAQEMVNLLGKIPRPDLQGHYLGVCANLLGNNDSKLTSLYNEKLRAELKKPQVKPEFKKKKKEEIELHKGEEETIYRAEMQLLKIYLHFPYHRAEIAEAMEEKNLCFSREEHKNLWLRIMQTEEEKKEILKENPNNLFSLMQDTYAELGEEKNKIQKIFNINEIGSFDLSRCNLMIPTALAALELLKKKKERRYCMEKWQSLDPITEAEKREYYRLCFLSAQKRIEELRHLRFVGIEQLL